MSQAKRCISIVHRWDRKRTRWLSTPKQSKNKDFIICKKVLSFWFNSIPTKSKQFPDRVDFTVNGAQARQAGTHCGHRRRDNSSEKNYLCREQSWSNFNFTTTENRQTLLQVTVYEEEETERAYAKPTVSRQKSLSSQQSTQNKDCGFSPQ